MPAIASLRLNSVDAKSHPVFTELTRVRQYFDKIQKIETPPEKRQNSLNTNAAIRFLKADLVWFHTRSLAAVVLKEIIGRQL
jgi:hypothetical protein